MQRSRSVADRALFEITFAARLDTLQRISLETLARQQLESAAWSGGGHTADTLCRRARRAANRRSTRTLARWYALRLKLAYTTLFMMASGGGSNEFRSVSEQLG